MHSVLKKYVPHPLKTVTAKSLLTGSRKPTVTRNINNKTTTTKNKVVTGLMHVQLLVQSFKIQCCLNYILATKCSIDVFSLILTEIVCVCAHFDWKQEPTLISIKLQTCKVGPWFTVYQNKTFWGYFHFYSPFYQGHMKKNRTVIIYCTLHFK